MFTDGLGGLNPAAYSTAATDGCDDVPVEDDPFPDSAGVWLQGWDPNSCSNALWDPDNDAVHNGCENALAAAFAPELIFTTAECKWDYQLSRLGGEYYVAVQRGSDQFYPTLRIAYLPAYYFDCGVRQDQVSECDAHVIPLVPNFCAGHTGDSEFVLIDVSYNFGTRHWEAERIFLSAHCGEVTGNECKWYPDLGAFEWRDGTSRGAPVVWVAEKKHANYPSQEACNSGVTVGIIEFEHCEFNNVPFLFPVVYTQQNSGSRASPLRDCAVTFSGSSEASQTAVECMWTELAFNGWQGYVFEGGSMPHSDVLTAYALF